MDTKENQQGRFYGRATDRGPGEVVHDAVDEYLERQVVNDVAWQERLQEVVGRLRAGVPKGEKPEIIESEIAAAREEMRAG